MGRVEPKRCDGAVRCARPGPRWAPVRDAGYTKDPITAQGISGVVRDEEPCPAARDQTFAGQRPFAEAMAAYQHTRDRAALPMDELTTQFATLEPPPELVQRLLGTAAGNREAMDALDSVIAGTLSPAEFFDPAHGAWRSTTSASPGEGRIRPTEHAWRRELSTASPPSGAQRADLRPQAADRSPSPAGGSRRRCAIWSGGFAGVRRVRAD